MPTNAFDYAADALESAIVTYLEGLSDTDIDTLNEYLNDLRGFAAEVEDPDFGITTAEEDERR